MEKTIDPKHQEARAVLRVVGPVLLLVGLVFMVIGLVSFFSAFGGHGPPDQFWCVFVGMPLLALGGAMTLWGFMGRISRYAAGELGPVGKDVFNYMAKGTKEGVRDIAAAVGEGLRGGAAAEPAEIVRCHKCNADNEPAANFCKNCGAALAKTKPCPDCNELNDPDARFCDNCGRALA